MEKKFPEKSEAFFHLEVKMVEAKKKAIDFGPVFGVAFFGKRFEDKNKEKQNQSNDEYRPSPTTLFTCHISRGNFHDTKNLYGNLKERIQLEGEVEQYLCLEFLGLRLELDKAVKCLYNTHI